MGRRRLWRTLGVLTAALAIFVVPGSSQAAGVGSHVFYINGISTIVGQPCQYAWADTDASKPGIQPERDAVGIPRPSTLPPTCKTDSNGHALPCSLKRNLGPYPADPAHPDLTAGEAGMNPPCSGNLSASDLPGEEGCLEPANPTSECGINAPTWFYGYCAQTYGGASSGTMRLGSTAYSIQRMGFPRGRGVWEFNGKISSGSSSGFLRYYLDALPAKNPDETGGCDVPGGNISAVEFFGAIVLSDDQLPRAFSPQSTTTHWNFCDTTDGC